MRDLKKEGHYLIIHTGRHMRTCKGDVEKVIERVGKVTEDWLEKWQVPYDELVFGKPYADMYIDDLGIEFSSSEKLGKKLESIQPVIIIPITMKSDMVIVCCCILGFCPASFIKSPVSR